MDLWTRYTLTYKRKTGQQLTCFNLLREECEDIERAQRQLGSTDFVRTAQPHSYSQMELDLLQRKNNDSYIGLVEE